MEKFILFLLLCHSSSAVKHSMMFFTTLSDGVTNFPEVVSLGLIDGFQAGYCDSNTNQIKATQPWLQEKLDTYPDFKQWFGGECFESQNRSRSELHNVMQRFHQIGGVHTFQSLSGCEWDDETEEVTGFLQFGYDGEDYLSFDLKTLTWIAPKQQAVITKRRWEADREKMFGDQFFLHQICPGWLKDYLKHGKNFLPETVPPFVSVLQKTPSSPVSCHATGFYPHTALMFWTRDGEELYEDVDQGEILLNHDGSFQMSVDLDVSSIKAEDWWRYDCVFHLSGLKDDIVTKLDKAHIRTNMGKPSIYIISALVPLVTLVFIAVAGFVVYKQKKAKQPSPSSDDSSDLPLAVDS